MDIATNAVLTAMLLHVSGAVKPLDLPLETPLEPSKVRYFRVFPEYAGSDVRLRAALRYEGGYWFRYGWGIIDSFETTNAYTTLQDPRELDRLVGEVRYTEAQCLAKFKDTLRALGHTNLAMLDKSPTVKGPIRFDDKVIPRYIFEWSDPKGRLPQWMKVVMAEVNAEQLRIECFRLIADDFQRMPWPITFGQTNPPPPSKPPSKMVSTELEVKDVSREYAMALIRHILPEIEDFGHKFGPPLNTTVQETDIVMGESKVQMLRGRVWASLRLNCGYQVDYWAGRVMKMHAMDAYTSKEEEGERPRVQEFSGPIRLTREQAVEKVRRLVLDKFALPEKPLYLDVDPTFRYAPELGETNGFCRYV